MVAAAVAWVPLRRLARRRRRALALAGFLLVGTALALMAWGWSFNGHTADALALPVFAFMAASAPAALAVDAHPHIRPVLFGALGVGSVLVWGGLQFHRAFIPEPAASAPLPDRYRYEVTLTGFAFTSDMAETRIFHTPVVLPLLEYMVARSHAGGRDSGLSIAGTITARVDSAPGRRMLVVWSEAGQLDAVAY